MVKKRKISKKEKHMLQIIKDLRDSLEPFRKEINKLRSEKFELEDKIKTKERWADELLDTIRKYQDRIIGFKEVIVKLVMRQYKQDSSDIRINTAAGFEDDDE